jgi:hypothetical protein
MIDAFPFDPEIPSGRGVGTPNWLARVEIRMADDRADRITLRLSVLLQVIDAIDWVQCGRFHPVPFRVLKEAVRIFLC